MGFLFDVDSKNVIKLIKTQRLSTILVNIPNYLVTPEACLVAVKANGMALKYVPKAMLTKTIIMHAIRENHQAYFLIANEDQEQLYLRYSVRVLVKKIKEIKIKF